MTVEKAECFQNRKVDIPDFVPYRPCLSSHRMVLPEFRLSCPCHFWPEVPADFLPTVVLAVKCVERKRPVVEA